MPDAFHRGLAAARRQIVALRGVIDDFGDRLFVPQQAVSAWSAGEHVDHVLKVMHGFLRQLQKDQPIDLPGLNLVGRAVLLTGWIPRGRGKSPERVRGARVEVAELLASAGSAEALLAALDTSPPKERTRPLARHPVFRGLNAEQSVRFITIHTEHHLRIVRDIGRSAAIRHRSM